MYDLFQYSNCQQIQRFPKNSPERAFILEITKNQKGCWSFLALLRVALVRPSEKIEQALADWIAFTFTKKIPEEAPIIPENVKAGRHIRQSPPIEEFNTIKRDITKAKISFILSKECTRKSKI